MKSGNLKKKLTLNKKTVSHLNNAEMKNFAGGVLGTGITCTVCNSKLSCSPRMCMYDFTNDGNTCSDYPTQTRVDTCPPLQCNQ